MAGKLHKGRKTCVIMHVVDLGSIEMEYRKDVDDLNRTLGAGTYENVKWSLQFCYHAQSDDLRFSLKIVSFNQSEYVGVLKLCLSSVFFNCSSKKWTQLFNNIHDHLEVTLPNGMYYAVDNKIEINYEVKLISDDETCTTCTEPTSLVKDLGQLLEEDSGDVGLCVGDQTLKVHKPIVMARSPVLAAILNEEGDQHHILDVDFDVMKIIVRYMYTDHADDIETNARKIYPAACKFALSGLKASCEKAIETSLTAENAAETLVLADALSKDLKARVIEFMKDIFEEITPTAGFKAMLSTHLHLFTEICCVIHKVDMPPSAHRAA